MKRDRHNELLFVCEEGKSLMEGKRKNCILHKGASLIPFEKPQDRRRKILQSMFNIYCSINRAEPTASASLSPVFIHFISPSSDLSLNLQELLQHSQTSERLPILPPVADRHPGPAKPHHEIPQEEWPAVLRRVVENQEPLRKVADDYGVSHETIRRIVIAMRKQEKAG